MKYIAAIWNKLIGAKINIWIMRNYNNKYCLWRRDGFEFKRINKHFWNKRN